MFSLHMFLSERFLPIQTWSPLSTSMGAPSGVPQPSKHPNATGAMHEILSEHHRIKRIVKKVVVSSQTVIVHEGRQLPPRLGLEGPMRCVSRLRPLPIITLIKGV